MPCVAVTCAYQVSTRDSNTPHTTHEEVAMQEWILITSYYGSLERETSGILYEEQQHESCGAHTDLLTDTI